MRGKLLSKWVILVLSVILSACFPGREISRPDANKTSGEPTIAFLVFKIGNDTVQGTSVIELISQTRNTGRIKEEHEPANEFSNYLTLEISEPGQKNRVIQMEHPLHRRIEYVDEDGKLAMKEITPNEAEFFVRIQVHGKSARVKVSEALKNGNSRALQIFKIEGK